MKVLLTDAKLRALKPEKRKKKKADELALMPYDVMDSEVRAFGVRVLVTGEISFILRMRFPGSKKVTRRALGRYGEISLKDARDKALDWRKLIRDKGIDPTWQAERERKAVEAERLAEIEAKRIHDANTFEKALEAYLLHKANRRKVGTIRLTLEREAKAWMKRPLPDIDQPAVKALVLAIKARTTKGAQGRVTLSMLKGLFTWAVDSGDYGLLTSPAANLKLDDLFGPPTKRARTLKDHEIRAIWNASARLGTPHGPFVRLLFLTAIRRNEVAEMRWSEIEAERWTILGRMKGGGTHTVPLTPAITKELEGLPRSGDYALSITEGRKPISSFSLAKTKLDALVKADLEAQGIGFEKWTFHDIRRTVRTRLSDGLGIPREVREMVIAHKMPALDQIYDQHDFESEKRKALEAWHAKLRSIVEPATGNVVPIRKVG